MTLIVDVDMNLLKELHEHGSVNTMKDRRHDLYNLTRLKNNEKFRMRGKKIIGRQSFVATVVVMPITIKLTKTVLFMRNINNKLRKNYRILSALILMENQKTT
jgi:hypothetical protein